MVLVQAAPEGVDRRRLEEDVQGARARLGLEAVTLADLAAGDARRLRHRPRLT